jgi:hypothetical protein
VAAIIGFMRPAAPLRSFNGRTSRNGIPSRSRFGYHAHASLWNLVMRWIFALCGLLACVGMASPTVAQDLGQKDFGQVEAPPCYWCIRDALYDDVKLINHLEANRDIDEGVKGPQIVAARADIHRLRALLGPLVQGGTEPCCYSRATLYIR